MASELPFKHLTIIGLGLIGGSVAMAAQENFPDWVIQGVDQNPSALDFAKKHGFINDGNAQLPERFEADHLIVLACHLSANLEILEQLAPKIVGQNILVTDIGSCKKEIATLGKTLLPAQFIAGHPMAGKEFSGVQHATPLLFANKSYLLCPHSNIEPERLDQLTAFVKSFGALPRLIDAERHDQYMAYVSHLPQLYAILLSNLLAQHEPDKLLTYYGGGLDDQLRLAASPFSMWGEIFAYNSDNMVNILQELKGQIDDILPLLTQNNPQEIALALQPWFERSNEVHRQFQALKANLQL